MPQVRPFFPLNETQKNQLQRDLQDFVRGRKRFIAIRRWVDVQDDEISKERVAAHIAELFRHVWLHPKEDESS